MSSISPDYLPSRYRIFDATSVPLNSLPQTHGDIFLAPRGRVGRDTDGVPFYWKLPSCSAGAFLAVVWKTVMDVKTTEPNPLERLGMLLLVKTNPALLDTARIIMTQMQSSAGASNHGAEFPLPLPTSPISPPTVSVFPPSPLSPKAMGHIPQRPHPDGPRDTSKEDSTWHYGPSWTSSDFITKSTGIEHPEPWDQTGNLEDMILVHQSFRGREPSQE
ncbi:hypothetical protein MVEN_01508000 [Mycena venus]|uniref:Uncharacterized protein n=1 Tax=Mycena venus TaxID=2733690 RepID=A0A8H7CU48_9AGAR|nr:hypothetical protein MVEN_01508000 [Mycena venus]